MSPRASVVVPTRNRHWLIEQTLESICAATDPSLEIIVVDQSTDSETEQIVSRMAMKDRRLRYHHTDTVGLAAGRNLGASLSTADVVLYTDDDCVVSEGWLPAIMAEFENEETAAVCGRLLPFESRSRTGLEVGFKPGEQRTIHMQKTPPWYIGHGGNMSFRRRDLLAIGGFDPLLGAGGVLRSGEDADITYRLLCAGKRIVYAPGALAFHRHWKDWQAQKQMERAYGVGAGAIFAKYMRVGDRYGLRLLLTWVWQLGVRRTAAGLLKWRNPRVMYLGYCQLVYPWLGIWRAQRYAIEPHAVTYVNPVEVRSFSLSAAPR